MKSLTFITGNAEKAKQLGKYLSFDITHTKLDIPEIQSLDLEEVATEKAKSAYSILRTAVLVEDTALTFESLNKLPGPLVKWFFESIGNEGLVRLLNGFDNRNATAETCFALCDETGVHLFKNSIPGTVADKPKGEGGYGWNPVFIPAGCSQTYAEMSPEEQGKHSMRRLAVEKLQKYLEANYK
jgi:non-canonical purine NTP pyrophosphatase (RdgB/HAM1 family)